MHNYTLHADWQWEVADDHPHQPMGRMNASLPHVNAITAIAALGTLPRPTFILATNVGMLQNLWQ